MYITSFINVSSINNFYRVRSAASYGDFSFDKLILEAVDINCDRNPSMVRLYLSTCMMNTHLCVMNTVLFQDCHRLRNRYKR